MNTWLWTAFAAIAFLANITMHEAAHAVVLRRLGGDIRAGGLGLPLFPASLIAYTLVTDVWSVVS